MPRFFAQDIRQDTVFLYGEDARHLSRVLRVRPGEKIMVCDGAGKDYSCVVTEVKEQCVMLKILETQASAAEPNVRVTLFQGLPKGDKMDSIIQKAVELGVWAVVPVFCDRSVSRPSEKDMEKKLVRWNRIAAEAAKQSGRGILPKVMPPMRFADAVSGREGLQVLFYEGGGSGISELGAGDYEKIGIYIGPEGGFEPSEVELFCQRGGRLATLGPRILRTETAPLAALSCLMLVTGNL